MTRKLSAPQNPELLVGTVAAMRLLSGERQPQNQLERETLAELQALRLKPEVARRIVAAFEAKPRRDRRRLLGRHADKSLALGDMAPPAEPHTPTRSRRGELPSASAPEAGPSSRSGPASEHVGPLSGERSTGEAPSIRYTIRYLGLWCQKETVPPGLVPDDWGADEIYVVTSGLAINKGVNSAVGVLTHPINTHPKYYEDVDTHEERIGPVAAVYSGNPDTLSLAVVVMEHDYGNPDYYRDEIEAFVSGAVALASRFWPPAVVLALFKDNIVDAINWILGTGDDVISSEVVTWERRDLEAQVSQTPAYYHGTRGGALFTTHLFTHFVTKHRGEGAEYVVGFDIERDPPPNRPPPIIL
ncbi:MAG: hypothetical protein LCH70_03350 [Proteobacteria bacterium]|nr:hypothetical protein [Pseudomonadota bacterium]